MLVKPPFLCLLLWSLKAAVPICVAQKTTQIFNLLFVKLLSHEKSNQTINEKKAGRMRNQARTQTLFSFIPPPHWCKGRCIFCWRREVDGVERDGVQRCLASLHLGSVGQKAPEESGCVMFSTYTPEPTTALTHTPGHTGSTSIAHVSEATSLGMAKGGGCQSAACNAAGNNNINTQKYIFCTLQIN